MPPHADEGVTGKGSAAGHGIVYHVKRIPHHTVCIVTVPSEVSDEHLVIDPAERCVRPVDAVAAEADR